MVEFNFFDSRLDTGIMPPNVPVTNASWQSLISLNLKSISWQSMLFSLQTSITLPLIIPFKQYLLVDVITRLFK